MRDIDLLQRILEQLQEMTTLLKQLVDDGRSRP